MKVLYLTNNPNVCSTSRILQSWLLLGVRSEMCRGKLCYSERGPFGLACGASGPVLHRSDAMAQSTLARDELLACQSRCSLGKASRSRDYSLQRA